MDPFSIAALGLGTVGSAVGAISNAATMEDRKKEWLARQRELAQRTALRNSRNMFGTNFFDPRSIDASYRKQDALREADERFKVDPASFLPFVQNATQLAGGIYDAASGPPQTKLPPPDALAAYDYSPQGMPAERQSGPPSLWGYDEDPLRTNRWGRLA